MIAEYYDWKGYLAKRNIKLAKLAHGGWKMELDVIAFDQHAGHLIHLQSSIDAHSWAKREERFTKKFNSAKKYILSKIFTWLDSGIEIEQVAVLISHPKGRDFLAGAKIVSIDEYLAEIREAVIACGIVAKNAIPEQYPC